MGEGGGEDLCKMRSCKVQVQPIEGEFKISLQLSHVLLLHLLWFWVFRGSKRVTWKLLCIKNCCLCLRNRSIWTSGATRWLNALPEVSPSSALWLHAHWETFSGFLCRMKVDAFLTVSTPGCCSTGGEQGMFVHSSTLWSSLLNFFLLPHPLHYEDVWRSLLTGGLSQ